MENLDNNKLNEKNTEQNIPVMLPEKSNGNLKIIIVVLAVVLVAIAGVVGFLLGNKKTSKEEVQIQNNNGKAESSSLDNQKVFAPSVDDKNIEEPFVFYAYEQFSPNITRIYKSSVDGKNKSEVNIDYAKDVNFLASKDGKYLARWDNNKLEVANTKDLSFKELAETSDINLRIGSVVWSSDGEKLAYIVYKSLNPDQPAFSENDIYLYVINRDGSGQKLIKRFEKLDYGVALEGFDPTDNELYWFKIPGDGGYVSDFTIVSLADGSILGVKKGLDPMFDSSINFSSDFSKAYYIKDNKIIEYTLANDGKKVLYELVETDPDKNEDTSFLHGLKLSPKDDFLIVAHGTRPETIEVPMLMNLSDGKIQTLLDNTKYTHLVPSYLSPSGKYLWFETWCDGCENEGSYYIMNMETRDVSLFFKSQKHEEPGKGFILNDTIQFISWLSM